MEMRRYGGLEILRFQLLNSRKWNSDPAPNQPYLGLELLLRVLQEVVDAAAGPAVVFPGALQTLFVKLREKVPKLTHLDLRVMWCPLEHAFFIS